MNSWQVLRISGIQGLFLYHNVKKWKTYLLNCSNIYEAAEYPKKGSVVLALNAQIVEETIRATKYTFEFLKMYKKLRKMLNMTKPDGDEILEVFRTGDFDKEKTDGMLLPGSKSVLVANLIEDLEVNILEYENHLARLVACIYLLNAYERESLSKERISTFFWRIFSSFNTEEYSENGVYDFDKALMEVHRNFIVKVCFHSNGDLDFFDMDYLTRKSMENDQSIVEYLKSELQSFTNPKVEI